jgi:zinc/manganese transport system substrate-binding protein
MIRKVLAISAATVLVAGCTSAEDNSTPTGPIAVTATTNVWGSIAEFIGGDMVEVTSIVDQPTIDPHSYEPSARDLLAVQDSEMVLVNGGGYDAFMESLIDQAEGSRVILRAVAGENTHDHSHDDEDHAHEGDEHSHAEGNEHVWYDFHVVEEVADQLLASFTQLRPESAGDFQSRYGVFVDELEVLEVRLEALREKALGYGVFSVTPLASIMIEEAGLKEFAPSEILEAVEEERDIPPAAIAEAIEIFNNPDVLMVITNDQVTDTQMQGIADAAAERGLPVVGLSELIPNEDWDYLDWMANNLDVLMATVDQSLPEPIEN